MAEAIAGAFLEFRSSFERMRQDMEVGIGILNNFQSRSTKIFKSAGLVAGTLFGGGLLVGLSKLGEAGDRLNDISDGFKKLGGSAGQIDLAKEKTLGLVSAFELMKLNSEGMVKNIPGIRQNFATLTEYSARLASTLGIGVAESISKVTSAIASGREKSLQQVGLTVDAGKAYETYAKLVGKGADELTKAQKKEALQLQVMQQLEEQTKRLAEVNESAGQGFAALKTSLSEAFGEFARGYDNSSLLAGALNELAKTTDNINFKPLGEALGALIGTFATLTSWIVKAGNALGNFTADRFEITKMAMEIAKAQGISLPEAAKQAEVAWKAAHQQLDATKTTTTDWKGELKHAGDEAEGAAKKVASLRGAFEKKLANTGIAEIKAALKSATEGLRDDDFRKYKDQLYKATYTSQLAASQAAIKSGAISMGEATDQAMREARLASDEAQADYNQKVKENADTLREEQKKAYEDGVNTWRSLFENAITGTTFNLKDALKQVAVGFAAQMAQGMLGSAGAGIGSAQDLGGALFKQTLGGIFNSGVSTAGSSLFQTLGATEAGGAALSAIGGTAGMTGAAAQAAGIAGPAMESGMFAAAGMGPVGWAALAGGAAFMFKDQIKEMFEGHNPETDARESFAGKINEILDKFDRISIFKDGKLTTTKDFNYQNTNSQVFSQPGWDKSFRDSDSFQAFQGLGIALQSLQGITEDVGSQLGFGMWQNFGDSIDSARLAVQYLGLDFKTVEEQLVKVGETGQKSWAEVEAGIQGASEAFKPGLAAVGDVKGAFQELIDSGGRGIAAIKAVKDIAVETMEAGGKSFEDMKTKLTEAGFDPEQIDALMKGIQQRGVQTLQALSEVNSRLGGGIVADMENASKSIATSWHDMSVEVEKISEALTRLPREIESRITFKVDADISGAAQSVINASGGDIGLPVTKHAKGGILSGPTMFGVGSSLHMAGEAGPEGILPLTTINGKLGVLSKGGSGDEGLTINIDARGAAPGVENRIRQSLMAVEERAVRRALQAMSDGSRRGRMGA